MVKSRGGERRVRSPGHDPGQVSVGKTSASKPFEDASLRIETLAGTTLAGTGGVTPIEKVLHMQS